MNVLHPVFFCRHLPPAPKLVEIQKGEKIRVLILPLVWKLKGLILVMRRTKANDIRALREDITVSWDEDLSLSANSFCLLLFI